MLLLNVKTLKMTDPLNVSMPVQTPSRTEPLVGLCPQQLAQCSGQHMLSVFVGREQKKGRRGKKEKATREGRKKGKGRKKEE